MNKLSVVITYYKDISYLNNILLNVSLLSRCEWVESIFIWDDGSPANEALDFSIFNSFEKVKCYRSEVNQGVYASRWLALQLVKTSHIWFIDSDDQVIEVPELIWSDITVYDFNGRKEHSDSLTYEVGMNFKLRDEVIKDKSTCVAWNKIFNKRLLDNLPYYCFRNGDDLFLTLYAISNADSITHINKPLINYLIRNNSLSRKYKKGRLHELSQVIYQLKKEVGISQFERVLLFYNYVLRNYLRSVIRNKNPLFLETLELVRCVKCLF